MMNSGVNKWALAATCLTCGASLAEAAPAAQVTAVEEVRVWGEPPPAASASTSAPTSVLDQTDFTAINAVTTEDLVKYEPSLTIRRRFIGDANGTLGMRGANMFQTSRALVFADGVPLHYLLQSRWSGAPRWTLVSASEIAQVEVIYGPFSAAYSGNAMGGVIVIETAIPQEREIQADVSVFQQNFDAYGYSGEPGGYKAFVSYGDKFGDASLYFSYNRLDTRAQPQTFYFAGEDEVGGGRAISGLIPGLDAQPRPDGTQPQEAFFGDTGEVDTTTDNFKLKLAYDLGEWRGLLNLAFEDRYGSSAPNSYARDANGAPVWSGPVSWNGQALFIPGERLAVSELRRESLSASLRLAGPLADHVDLTVDLNRFDILKDTTGTGARNPRDPAFDGSGQVADYRDSGWTTAGIGLSFDELAGGALSLRTGARVEEYELNYDIFASPDYAGETMGDLVNTSGGRTEIGALYAEADFQLGERWNLIAGARYERFASEGGYYSEGEGAALRRVVTPDTEREAWSPKLSLGFEPATNWTLRYSVARAYRFPIVEELFSQFSAYNVISEANPALAPEAGLHHNLLINRELPGGYARVNFFQETVRDVIESQTITVRQAQNTGVSLRTFVPVDEVDTRGVELIYNTDGAFGSRLALRANLTWTESTIEKNNADPSIEGNAFPRLPEWRAHLLASYPLSQRFTASVNWQYASDSFGRLDNRDNIDRVYGAQDSYSRVGARASFDFDRHWQLALGVDNLNDQVAYVAHPWPGRTFYLDLRWRY